MGRMQRLRFLFLSWILFGLLNVVAVSPDTATSHGGGTWGGGGGKPTESANGKFLACAHSLDGVAEGYVLEIDNNLPDPASRRFLFNGNFGGQSGFFLVAPDGATFE